MSQRFWKFQRDFLFVFRKSRDDIAIIKNISDKVSK